MEQERKNEKRSSDGFHYCEISFIYKGKTYSGCFSSQVNLVSKRENSDTILARQLADFWVNVCKPSIPDWEEGILPHDFEVRCGCTIKFDR